MGFMGRSLATGKKLRKRGADPFHPHSFGQKTGGGDSSYCQKIIGGWHKVCILGVVDQIMATTLQVQHRSGGTSLTKAVRQMCCAQLKHQQQANWSIKPTGQDCHR
jgi:hypothetical protein